MLFSPSHQHYPRLLSILIRFVYFSLPLLLCAFCCLSFQITVSLRVAFTLTGTCLHVTTWLCCFLLRRLASFHFVATLGRGRERNVTLTVIGSMSKDFKDGFVYGCRRCRCRRRPRWSKRAHEGPFAYQSAGGRAHVRPPDSLMSDRTMAVSLSCPCALVVPLFPFSMVES